ncbi:MAG: hypothetical protein HY401_05835 [Elusimicrobia bacterium]|nr:hypothetical protein [Elusimicrobiota bacterium]
MTRLTSGLLVLLTSYCFAQKSPSALSSHQKLQLIMDGGGMAVQNTGAVDGNGDNAIGECSNPIVADALRCFVTMDDNTRVIVDNNSGYPNEWVGSLVLAADRSTQTDTPFETRAKGLFKKGDLIYVDKDKILWFDFTRGDGKKFDYPYSNQAVRSGALAGWWSLKEEMRPEGSNLVFRYPKVGPSSKPGWAHNQLISGSASPNGQEHWWDAFSWGVEHTIGQLISPANPDKTHHMTYEKSAETPTGNWTIVKFGTREADGFYHYATSGRMINIFDDRVDIGRDPSRPCPYPYERCRADSGPISYIDSHVEYIIRPTDVVVKWRFKITSDTTSLWLAKNIYVYYWTAYEEDMDDPDEAMRPLPESCDAGRFGNQFPDQVYGQPIYVQSNERLLPNGVSVDSSLPPGSVARLLFGLRCPPYNGGNYQNYDIDTYPPEIVRSGSWIRLGEELAGPNSLSFNAPNWQLTLLSEPTTGTGTEQEPEKISWNRLLAWVENRDGTIGFGFGSGPGVDNWLRAGRWYGVRYSLKANSNP